MSANTPLVIGQTIRTVVFTLNDAQLGLNTRYWQISSIASGNPTLGDLAQELDVKVEPHYKALCSDDTDYRGVQAQVIDPILSTVANSDINQGFAAGGMPVMPKQTCGFIKFVSETAGRSGRGRNYVPFPAAPQNEAGGNPTPAYQAEVALLATDLTADLLVDDGLGNVALAVPVLYNRTTKIVVPVTGFVVPDKWATQRRRSDFGATNQAPF